MRTVVVFILLIISFLSFFNCSDNKSVKPEKRIVIKKKKPEEIAELSKKSTVKIYGFVRDEDLIYDDKKGWSGSGVIIDKKKDEYVVITNLHVTGFYDFFELDNSGNPEIIEYNIAIVLPDKKQVKPYSIMISNKYKDFALLKLKTKRNYPVLPLADKLPKMGNKVYAMGHPEGLDYSFTTGIVSSVKHSKKYKWIIQTDTAINHGNSGGGMFDEYGELIGVNTWVFRKDKTEGLNFAISAKEIVEAIREKKFIEMPMEPKRLTDFICEINKKYRN